MKSSSLCRFLHAQTPPVGATLQPGDLESALLAGLARGRRNKVMREMLQAGRPAPSCFKVAETAGGVLTCEPTSTVQHEGGHSWHGRCVVAKIAEAGGDQALQARPLFDFLIHCRLQQLAYVSHTINIRLQKALNLHALRSTHVRVKSWGCQPDGGVWHAG